MAKLHHTEYKKNYKKYILDCVELDCEEKPIKTDEEKIKYIFDRFNSEFGWNIERIGKHKAMTEWLQGLALNIEYYNDDIVKLAIKLGSIEENPSEKLQARVKDNYWSFMANIILGFEPKYSNIDRYQDNIIEEI
jgi:superoxide dismutase